MPGSYSHEDASRKGNRPGPDRRGRSLRLRHPRYPQYRALRRARRSRGHGDRARDLGGCRRVCCRRVFALVGRGWRDQRRTRGRCDLQPVGHRRGLDGQCSDGGDRERYPDRYQQGLPAPCYRSARRVAPGDQKRGASRGRQRDLSCDPPRIPDSTEWCAGPGRCGDPGPVSARTAGNRRSWIRTGTGTRPGAGARIGRAGGRHAGKRRSTCDIPWQGCCGRRRPADSTCRTTRRTGDYVVRQQGRVPGKSSIVVVAGLRETGARFRAAHHGEL